MKRDYILGIAIGLLIVVFILLAARAKSRAGSVQCITIMSGDIPVTICD